jgi:hypothetical protein
VRLLRVLRVVGWIGVAIYVVPLVAVALSVGLSWLLGFLFPDGIWIGDNSFSLGPVTVHAEERPSPVAVLAHATLFLACLSAVVVPSLKLQASTRER